jgi:hypothetical protein
MKKLGADQGDIDETTVAGRKRILCFTDDPNSKQTVSFDDARAALTEALHDLPRLEQEANQPRPAVAAIMAREAPPRVTLALDEVEETGLSMRPNLPYRGGLAGPMLSRAPAATARPRPPLSPQKLDPATFVEDDEYVDIVSRQPNLDAGLKDALYAAYGRRPSRRAATGR